MFGVMTGCHLPTVKNTVFCFAVLHRQRAAIHHSCPVMRLPSFDMTAIDLIHKSACTPAVVAMQCETNLCASGNGFAKLLGAIDGQKSEPAPVITFALFFLVYIVLAHFMATSYIFIGVREVGRKTRFDTQDMFTDITARNFITPGPDVAGRTKFKYI